MSTPTPNLLGRLKSINWTQLIDAYGSADAVPIVFRPLRSADPDVYLPALDECWSRIFQGTRYGALVEAVLLLFYLNDYQATKYRRNLLFEIATAVLEKTEELSVTT